jgi:uracil-DNA glycosylase family 4
MVKRSKKEVEEAPLYVFENHLSKMDRLKEIYDKWYGCTRCPLSSHRGTDDELSKEIVFGEGNPDAKIMIVGEAPGAEEVDCGIPFVGASGKLLNQILAATSDNPAIQELAKWYNTERHTPDNQAHFHTQMMEWRKEEFFIANIVACRPPDNRTPTHPEAQACWERLLNTIYVVDPWLIIASGKPAIETLTHKKIEITKKRGELFDVEMPGHMVRYRIPIIATLHPSYLLRVADYKSKTGSYVQTLRDFRWAFTYVDGLKQAHLGTPIPFRPEIPKAR